MGSSTTWHADSGHYLTTTWKDDNDYGPTPCKNNNHECIHAECEGLDVPCYDCMYDDVKEATRIVHNATVCMLCNLVEHYRDSVRIVRGIVGA